jgi:hypothetical protein
MAKDLCWLQEKLQDFRRRWPRTRILGVEGPIYEAGMDASLCYILIRTRHGEARFYVDAPYPDEAYVGRLTADGRIVQVFILPILRVDPAIPGIRAVARRVVAGLDDAFASRWAAEEAVRLGIEEDGVGRALYRLCFRLSQ